MKIPYRLGLDIGTNSLGWAMLELKDGAPGVFLDAGVRIFQDGRKPGKDGILGDPLAVTRSDLAPTLLTPNKWTIPGKPLAVTRRDARSMRRRHDRLLQRRRTLVNFFVKEGLWPNDPELRFEYSLWDPYTLRTQALTSELKPEELGRVLLHLCQRRGFKSNRKDIAKDDEKGVNKERMKVLDEELQQSQVKTLGEFMNTKKRQGIRFRGNSPFYADRKHYENEFKEIQAMQKNFFPSLHWKRIEEILFFQRPLKKQKRGRCRYYPDQERAHKFLPSTQRFRILQELSNLRIINSHGESESLSHDEWDYLYHLLENQKTLEFNSLRNKLNTDCRFNLEDDKRKELLGNATSFLMRKPELFGALWDELDDEKQDEIVECIMEADTNDELLEYLNTLPIKNNNKQNLLEVTLPRAMGSFSSILNRECVRVMKREYCGYSDALEKLGFNHRADEGKGEEDLLLYYGEILRDSCIQRNDPNQNPEEAEFGKIGNPTVHIALNQLRKVINVLIKKYGKPEEIVIELSRELKNGRKRLQEIIKEQGKNQKRNAELKAELTDIYKFAYPSRSDREKLAYYKELQKNNIGAQCPYCGKVISASELFSGSIEVEHILPFSRTLDNGRSNKTVAHISCNRVKRERSPYEAFGENQDNFDWESIQSRIRTLPKSKQWRFHKNAMERFEDVESGFLQRQLTDNAYIAKVARQYLTSICPSNKIWCTTGRQTAVLRQKWNLNAILSQNTSQKNRSDHRHHAVDAAVIGLIDRSMVKKIAVANRREEGDLNHFKFSVPDFPGGDENYDKLFQGIKRILPSFKPEHGLQGRFFKETAYGKIKKALPLKAEELTKKLIPNIVPARIRQEVESIIDEKGFTKATIEIRNRNIPLFVLQHLWVTSKPITDMKEQDLRIPSYGANIQGPSDFSLRKKLREYIGNHPDIKREKALEMYSKKYGIHRLRYIPKNQKITPIASSPGKGYELDDYAYVDIWMLPSKKGNKPRYTGVFVSRLEANQIQQKTAKVRRPHPAAKKLMRLFKQDTIAILEHEEWKYYRVSGYSTTQNKIDIQPIWKAEEHWFDLTNQYSLPTQYAKTSRSNHKSINALWQKSAIKKITVYYDGSHR